VRKSYEDTSSSWDNPIEGAEHGETRRGGACTVEKEGSGKTVHWIRFGTQCSGKQFLCWTEEEEDIAMKLRGDGLGPQREKKRVY